MIMGDFSVFERAPSVDIVRFSIETPPDACLDPLWRHTYPDHQVVVDSYTYLRALEQAHSGDCNSIVRSVHQTIKNLPPLIEVTMEPDLVSEVRDGVWEVIHTPNRASKAVLAEETRIIWQAISARGHPNRYNFMAIPTLFHGTDPSEGGLVFNPFRVILRKPEVAASE